MSHYGSNTNNAMNNSHGWPQQSQNGFSCPPQFLNIPGLPPYSPQKCNKTCSSPCCSSGHCPMGYGASPPPHLMQSNRNFSNMSRNPPQGIRLRCPSCCRPVGSCCCGCCNCASKSKTFY